MFRVPFMMLRAASSADRELWKATWAGCYSPKAEMEIGKAYCDQYSQ
jgi:hypothetical protein